MPDEPLSAYVRRTRGQIDDRGPDWLADRIQELEEPLAMTAKREYMRQVLQAILADCDPQRQREC